MNPATPNEQKALAMTLEAVAEESLHAHSDQNAPQLPNVMRIGSLQRSVDGSQVLNRATLHHRRASICVEWKTPHADDRLHKHGLVQVRYAATASSRDGAVAIHGLRPLRNAVANVNLFETLLPIWCKDNDLVERAANLWAQLPSSLGYLMNEVLWEHQRLHRFVAGPSSIDGHHNQRNGNFRHSVEVSETAVAIAKGRPGVSASLLILGGLLHDVGKADEYQLDHRRQRFLLSTRGELIGHRQTVIEWLSAARKNAGDVSETTWLALIHMLVAANGAPRWLGLRQPRTLEAQILSMADRLSSQQDLHQRCATPARAAGFGDDARFGEYHPHLGVRPFILPAPQ